MKIEDYIIIILNVCVPMRILSLYILFISIYTL